LERARARPDIVVDSHAIGCQCPRTCGERNGLMLLAILWEIWNYGVQEFAMVDQEKIDWSQCSLVAVDPLVLSGAPVLRGTRMPANAIIDNYDYGMSVAEISEQFEVPEESILAILTYAKSHRVAHPV
jgi:uncharacterized protein (DUF433 family)